jgi:hypothetical protein
MLRFASSDDHFVLVGVNSGAGADFSRAEERILHLATLANGAGAVATLIIVVDPDAELPEAVWRKRLAEARARILRLRFALVTRSSAARVIFHIMEWLTPAQVGKTGTTVATFADAVEWAEKDAGHGLPFLVEVYRQARLAIEDGSGSAQRLRSAQPT